MVSVPLVKIFSLTIKTLAKPVAKRIKSEAERQPILRGALHNMGQLTNSLSLRADIWMAGHTTTKIKPLEERKAVTAGGDLLAEGIIYAMGAGLVVWEYMYSAGEKERKDAAAKIKKQREQKDLAEALETINERLLTVETGMAAIAAKAAAANRSAAAAAAEHHSSISSAPDGNSGMHSRRGQSSLTSRWRWSSFLGGWIRNQSEPLSGNGARSDEGGGSESGVERGFVENGSAFDSRDPLMESSGGNGTEDKKAGLKDRGSSS